VPAASSSFVTDYLAGEFSSFFRVVPGDTAAALAEDPKRPRAELAAALREEAGRLGAPPAALAAIERLARPNSRVVVTGQQPGLLLGPAFTISKAISAIRLARRLDEEDRPVVPVFWVAAQDHDGAEIDHAHILDAQERVHRLALPLPPDVPSGSIPWRDEWRESVRTGLELSAPRGEHLIEVLRLIDEAAERAQSYADLFGGILYRLLGEHGLVVLDPTRPALAPLFRGVLERELADPRASVDAIVTAGERMRELGNEPQLGRGQDATNLFLCEDEGGMPRRRLLRFDGQSFHTSSRSYESEELRSILCREPWRITPAAGLRPVTQDAVLPTAAFVVGPGELRYLAQLGGVYRHHGIEMPLVWPRAGTVVLEPPVRRILERWELDYRTYASERGAALERVLLERHGHADAFESLLDRLESDGEELVRHVRAIDPTLDGTVSRSGRRIDRSIRMMRSKAAQALARQDEITRRQFERLESQLFPAGMQQERCLSPFSFFLKFGIGPMMALYLQAGETGEHLLTP
jgi:bacillithiol biosynthesis cysteine-adding enzyme BshC